MTRLLMFPILTVGLLATSALGQTPPPSTRQAVADVVVNMRDVEIADVADQISRITGRTLILDPAVRGRVNVTSAEPLNVAGVWDLFQSVLRVQGFAAVRSGRAWRIIPQANAVRDAGSGVRGVPGNQDVVTRLIRLRNLSPDAAVRVLRPLIASFGTVEALTDPDAVVVTDYAENVRRVERLARALDSGGGASFDNIVLRNASARDVATAIQSVMGDNGARIVADERSNTILIRGDASALAEARRLSRVLDQPGGATPITRVFRLTNADAESITDVLRGLLGEGGAATNPVARSLASGSRTIGAGTLNSLAGQSGGGGSLTGTAIAGGALGSNLGGSLGGAQSLGSGNLGGGGFAGGASSGGTQKAQGFTTPDLAIQPAPEINAIVARGTPSAIAAIEPLITELDVRRPQVRIEAAIVEITGDQAEALGVQLGLGAAAITNADGGATSFGTLGLPLQTLLAAINPVVGGALLASGASGNIGIGRNFSILLQALSNSSRANLLSTPSVTTLDNTPAEIVVGQNVPFRTGSFASDSSSLGAFTTIQRQDVGITLRVVPRIHQGDVVRLDVSQEVSSLVGAVTGAADLITNRRSIQTTVLADNGGTIVLGGLISDDRQQTRSQVPILGDIPLIGEAFKARQNTRTKRTLFVFLKPTILRDKASVDAATEAQYARVRGEEALNEGHQPSLLLHPPGRRLTVEIDGIY